jgi:hypothetical protein
LGTKKEYTLRVSTMSRRCEEEKRSNRRTKKEKEKITKSRRER